MSEHEQPPRSITEAVERLGKLPPQQRLAIAGLATVTLLGWFVTVWLSYEVTRGVLVLALPCVTFLLLVLAAIRPFDAWRNR
jgi:hypothetical protein